MQAILSRISLLTTYKSFITPLIDYADVNYEQRSDGLFSYKIDPVQYQGPIKGFVLEKLYQELGLENIYINIYYLTFSQALNNITFSEVLTCFQYLIFIITFSVDNICRILGLLYFLLMFLVFPC